MDTQCTRVDCDVCLQTAKISSAGLEEQESLESQLEARIRPRLSWRLGACIELPLSHLAWGSLASPLRLMVFTTMYGVSDELQMSLHREINPHGSQVRLALLNMGTNQAVEPDQSC